MTGVTLIGIFVSFNHLLHLESPDFKTVTQSGFKSLFVFSKLLNKCLQVTLGTVWM